MVASPVFSRSKKLKCGLREGCASQGVGVAVLWVKVTGLQMTWTWDFRDSWDDSEGFPKPGQLETRDICLPRGRSGEEAM